MRNYEKIYPLGNIFLTCQLKAKPKRWRLRRKPVHSFVSAFMANMNWTINLYERQETTQLATAVRVSVVSQNNA